MGHFCSEMMARQQQRGTPWVLTVLSQLYLFCNLVVDFVSAALWLTVVGLTRLAQAGAVRRRFDNSALHLLLCLPRWALGNGIPLSAVAGFAWTVRWVYIVALADSGFLSAIIGTSAVGVLFMSALFRGERVLRKHCIFVDHAGWIDAVIASWDDFATALQFAVVVGLVLRLPALLLRSSSAFSFRRACSEEWTRALAEPFFLPFALMLCTVAFWRAPGVWCLCHSADDHWQIRQTLVSESLAGLLDAIVLATAAPPLLLTLYRCRSTWRRCRRASTFSAQRQVCLEQLGCLIMDLPFILAGILTVPALHRVPTVLVHLGRLTGPNPEHSRQKALDRFYLCHVRCCGTDICSICDLH